MSSPKQFIEDGVEAAKRAVQFDKKEKYEAAAYYYKIAASLLAKAAELSTSDKADSLNAKTKEYLQRAKSLNDILLNKQHSFHSDMRQQRLKQFKFLMQQALDADQSSQIDVAIQFYMNTVEFATSHPEIIQGEAKDLTMRALERAEVLKGVIPVESGDSETEKETEQKAVQTTWLRSSSVSSTKLSSVGGSNSYSDEEKKVLFYTSRINNIDYVPFMTIDLREKFQYIIPFTDKDGHLKLSPKQHQEFSHWVRLEEICPDPCIVKGDHPDCFSLKQTIVSDCSFVASLAVSSANEKRFGRQLITSIIFPRNKDKKPLYNPFGKYMVKLHLNGVTRKIIIDDYLPMNKYGKLLCSFSSIRNEFWVSLLEKAYMKVMGGYDFPGSNSNIDLHTLTGWIPERIAIKPKDGVFNKDGLFSTLETRMQQGDVLVTVATGDMIDAETERTGLVGTHAYAVLDVRTVDGVRLLQLKNPWSHLRWRGNYSELDVKHWTPELQKTLNYDPNNAAEFDNGVFWIDYDSICAFFDVFYMNWNPDLFKYTYCMHEEWSAGLGPIRDIYTIGANPQFTLDVGNETSGAVWILLTRHIMDIKDFKENREYITLLVYNGNGKRVYYPMDPPPFIDGVRINSPHYLCKIILRPSNNRKYTLVVSQYEKTATIYYTLRAYATCPFTLRKLIDPFVHSNEILGEWSKVLAGGCANHPETHKNNPQYKVEITSPHNKNQLFVELKGPKEYQIGFDVSIIKLDDDEHTAPFKSISSGDYRSGFVVLDLDNIPAGSLMVMPSTYFPNQLGPFILTIKCSAPIAISRAQ